MGMKAFRHSRKVTKSARWQRLRLIILKRDEYKCVQCGSAGRLEIDHIKSVRIAPELSFEPNNLQALCASCHSHKTLVERGYKPATPERKQWNRFLKVPTPLLEN